ncbi:MAG: NlpC/P60 family protein [Actinomycetota bacterium]
MQGRRGSAARRLAVVVSVFTLVVGLIASSSLAAPSQEDVRAAEGRLVELQRRFELVAERYNQARFELGQSEQRLAAARDDMRAAQAQAEEAMDRLATRAVAAYMGTGSQVDGLLGAGNVTEFSDRLEFMGAVSASDAEIALAAEIAEQEARWAADEYEAAVAESRQHVASMSRDRTEIERLLDAQEEIYEQLQVDYEAFIAAQRAAADRAAETEATTSTVPSESTGSTGDTGSTGGTGGTGYVPPPNASKAQIAVQAAYSVVGTRYVWGSSDPSVGLDCSGVTVYAWRQAGVSLPHSSEAQYSMFPRIPLSEVQPGDLIYYGNYGPHIAIYVGGGNIIHASSPAPGGQTRLDSMYGYDEPWGAVRVA